MIQIRHLCPNKFTVTNCRRALQLGSSNFLPSLVVDDSLPRKENLHLSFRKRLNPTKDILWKIQHNLTDSL
jgi:hypothetical protein